jgi:GntR family transcriptional repressor for pyruvate dehydrogenase complex
VTADADAGADATDEVAAAPRRGQPGRGALNVHRTEKVSEAIARQIVKDSRGMAPGTRLPPEAKLLEKYGVARNSLREGLRILEVQGLIVIRPGPGGGPMIAEVDSVHFSRMASLYLHRAGATYRDTLEARIILEPMVAGIVAQRQDPHDVQVLTDYLEASEAETVEEPAGPFSEEERALEFHAMLMEMSGNPVLTLIVRSLQDLLVERWEATRSPSGDVPHMAGVHDMITRAIIEGRPAQAEQLMREHMMEFFEEMVAHDPARLDETISWH